MHALGPRFDIRDDDLDSLLDYRASRWAKDAIVG
jgi:hypothetical protein